MLLSENLVSRACLADVAVNKNELSVSVMGQPCSADRTAVVTCADKAGEQVEQDLGKLQKNSSTQDFTAYCLQRVLNLP